MEELLNIFKTKANIARKLGVKPQSINTWFKTGKLPLKRCKQIEVLTNGKIKRQDLRKDIFDDVY